MASGGKLASLRAISCTSRACLSVADGRLGTGSGVILGEKPLDSPRFLGKSLGCSIPVGSIRRFRGFFPFV